MSTTDDSAAEVVFDPMKPFRCREPANQIKDWRAKDDGRGYEALIHHPIGPGALTEAGRGPWWHSYGLDGRHHCSRPGSRDLDLVNDPAPVEPAGDPVRDGGAWRRIETAPKNGTCVLYMTLLARGFVYGVAYFEEGDWICNASGADVHPTHWRPIPAPSALARDVEPAPQPDLDRETAITTLLAQVGSSHEAYPGAKRDLVRAFLARHGVEARGEVGAGDDAAFVTRMEKTMRPDRLPAEDGRLLRLARRGVRAPVAGGEPVALVWVFVASAGNPKKEHDGERWLVQWNERSGTYDIGCIDGSWAYGEEIKLLAVDAWAWLPYHPPVPAAPTAERAHPKPPHGHQAPPAAPVGGVSEACNKIAEGIKQLRRTWERVNAYEPIKALSEALCVVDIVRDRSAPTPDDGCPKGDPDCLGGNGDCHDACSTFAERGAVEAAVAAERERCVSIVGDFTTRWGEHALRRYLVKTIRNIPVFEKSK